MIDTMHLRFRKPQHIAATVIGFLLLAAAGFYFLDLRNRGQIFTAERENAVPKGPEAVSIPGEKKEAPPTASLVVPEGATSRNLPAYSGEPVTKLNPDPKVAVSVGAALVEKYQKNLADIAGRVAQNAGTYDDWLGVAYIKKLFNNYIGVRDALEYAKVVNPQGPVAYFNLGELYGYELHDLAKAEENYKSALRLDPHSLDYYVGLANFYEDIFKDSKKAESVLLSALEIGNIPHTEVNLFTTIGAFYRDQKDYVKAIEYFEKALSVAQDPGIKKTVQDEIDYIRSKQ